MPGIGWSEMLVVILLPLVLILPTWRICAKAGFLGFIGIGAAVPFLNLCLLFFLAFAKWPALSESTTSGAGPA